jgi:hypothetical protein
MRTKASIAIFVGIMFVTLMGYTPKSDAQLSIGIGINVPLPHVVLHAPPAMVVIPGTYAYYAPDAGVEIFFYHGYWYRSHHDHWYRARGYNGPWRNIRHTRVPHAFRNIPPDFRRTVRHHKRIRYADFHKHWRTWEKQKHWDRRVKRREVRKVRHDAKIDVNHGRHQVREVHHVEKKKITRSPYEERNVRHNRITESSHGGHGWQAEKKKYK